MEHTYTAYKTYPSSAGTELETPNFLVCSSDQNWWMFRTLARMAASSKDAYHVVGRVRYVDKFPVTVYKSKRTGLHVVLAELPVPSVSCQINFATSTRTHDGLPHTLEHLVFMGSKNHPVKGTLDRASLFHMAVGGTNAYTAQDHTAYTVKTMGQPGMAEFLPIYADHLLNPLLTEENYRSEVYHVRKDGVEAGVVYSEMQAVEPQMERRMYRAQVENLYAKNPEFYVETGGKLKEIRELCSLERVRNYHKYHYHRGNMWILLSGCVDESILKAVDKIDAADAHPLPENFVRPFVNEVIPDLTKHRSDPPQILRCPVPHESKEGCLEVGFLTSRSPMDSRFQSALSILTSYLSDGTASPLMRELTLIAKPFCDETYFASIGAPRSSFIAHFSSVPLDRMDELPEKFFEVMKAESAVEKIDLERMRFIIKRRVKSIHDLCEGNVSTSVFSAISNFQLFSPDLSDISLLENTMRPLDEAEFLLNQPVEFWADLMKEVFGSQRVCVIHGIPDTELAKRLAEEDKQRTAKLVPSEDLGTEIPTSDSDSSHSPAGFDEATDADELRRLDFSKIGAGVVTTQIPAKSEPSSLQLSNDLKFGRMPFHSTVHAADTQFARAHFLFDLSHVPVHLRALLPLFSELLFTSAAKIDGELVTASDVDKRLTKELMSHSFGPGLSGDYHHLARFFLSVPAEDFQFVGKWARALLQDAQFDAANALALLQNMANSASNKKRSGSSMVGCLMDSLVYDISYQRRLHDEVVLEPFHRQLISELEAGNSAKLLSELDELRRAILSAPANLHLIADPQRLRASEPVQEGVWDFIGGNGGKISIDQEADVLRHQNFSARQAVLPLDASESSFLYRRIRCPVKYGSREHVSLMLFSSYLSMMEGPLWKEVRGGGFAYGCSVALSSVSETMALTLYRCSQLRLAYEKSRDAVGNEPKEINERLMNLARKSLLSSLMSGFETLKRTAKLAPFNDVRGVSVEQIRGVMSDIATINTAEAFRLSRPQMLRLFDDQHSVTAVVCPQTEMEAVQQMWPNVRTVGFDDLHYGAKEEKKQARANL